MEPGALRIPGHSIRRELGRGGMGIVLEAWSERLARPVALKLVRPDTPLDPETLARFRREIAAASRLAHPNVVAVLDTGEAAGRPWVALELVEGESLAARLRRQGPLPASEAARIGRALADALAAAHARGVLHRDLKPGNVLLDRAGSPRLTDFGLARILDGEGRLTATGVALGTPAYMAPEQASGDPALVGPPCDVYGLGALLYELLCGSPPFPGASALAVLEAVQRRPPVPPSQVRRGVDPGLEALALACLEKAPDRRPAGALAVRDALDAWLRGARPNASTPVALVATALLVAGLSLATLVALLQPAPPPPTPAPTGVLSPEAPTPPARDAADWLSEAARARAAGDAAAARRALQRAASGEDPLRAAEARWRLHELTGDEAPSQALRPGEELRQLAGEPAAEPWSELAACVIDLEEGRVAAGVARARALGEAHPQLAWAGFLQAEGLRRLGDVDAAWTAFERALERDPRSPAFHFLGVVLARTRRDEEAMRRHAEACFESPLLRPEGKAAALMTRSGARRSAGELEAALQDAERAVELTPADPRAWEHRAAARLALGDLPAAEADLARAEAQGLSPQSAELLRGTLAKARGDEQGAVLAFQRALTAGAPRSLRVDLADSLLLLGRTAEAQAALEAAWPLLSQLSPSAATLALRLKARLHHLGGGELGDEELARLVRLGAITPDSDLHVADLIQRGQPEAAWEAVQRLLARDPSDARGLCLRAWLRLVREDPPGAEADASAALALAPQLREALTRRAEARGQLPGRAADAVADLRAAARLAPPSLVERVNLGAWLVSSGRAEEARRELEAVLAERPDAPRALLNHARVCLEQGEVPAALASAERLCQLAKRDEGWRATGLMLRSRVRAASGDLDGALDDARALRAAPGDVDPEAIQTWLEELERRRPAPGAAAPD